MVRPRSPSDQPMYCLTRNSKLTYHIAPFSGANPHPRHGFSPSSIRPPHWPVCKGPRLLLLLLPLLRPSSHRIPRLPRPPRHPAPNPATRNPQRNRSGAGLRQMVSCTPPGRCYQTSGNEPIRFDMSHCKRGGGAPRAFSLLFLSLRGKMTDVVAFAVADVTLPTAPTCFLMMIGRGEAFFGNGCRKRGTEGVGIAFTRLVARGRTNLGMSHFP